MQNVLFPVFYFPPISWFSEFLKTDNEIIFEQYEHFPKQTFRNRTNIYGANGKLSLIIPIKHNGKKQMKEIEVSDVENWRALHWKSIKNAYRSSPYFEFYEDRLKKIYESEETSLFKLNLLTINIILQLLKQEKAYRLNEEYSAIPESMDFRNHFSAKKQNNGVLKEYYQTFSDKLGFLEDLSILDLLCNIGPESLQYLRNNSK